MFMLLLLLLLGIASQWRSGKRDLVLLGVDLRIDLMLRNLGVERR